MAHYAANLKAGFYRDHYYVSGNPHEGYGDQRLQRSL